MLSKKCVNSKNEIKHFYSYILSWTASPQNMWYILITTSLLCDTSICLVWSLRAIRGKVKQTNCSWKRNQYVRGGGGGGYSKEYNQKGPSLPHDWMKDCRMGGAWCPFIRDNYLTFPLSLFLLSNKHEGSTRSSNSNF